MNESLFKPGFSEKIEDKNDEIDIREMLEKHWYHWKWYVFSVIITLIMAFLYLRYTSDKFEVSSTILIDEQDVGSQEVANYCERFSF